MKQHTNKLSNRIMALCLTLCMLIGLISGFPSIEVTAAGETHTHDDVTFEPWTATDSLPTSGSYYLTADVTLSSAIKPSFGAGTINLCLNGYNIYVSGDNTTVYIVELGVTALNIYDCSSVTHKFNTSSDAWVLDETNGTETLTGGMIYGGVSIGAGEVNVHGGIFYTGNNAAIKMSSSLISGKISLHNGAIVGCNGVCGASIVGLYTMSIYITMNIYDGFRICGNSGSGVYVGPYGVLNMYGGSIDNNTGSTGGGIQMTSNGTGISEVNLYGGVIENNKATEAGGGIHVNGKLNIKGAPVVKNNTVNGAANNIYTGLAYTQVHFTEELTAGADLGFTHKDISTTAYITTSEVDFLAPLYVGETGYIKSDNANYYTDIHLDRVILMDKNHTHSTADGICSGCNMLIKNGVEYYAWEKTNSLPKHPGNYYLTDTVVLSSTWTAPEGEVNIYHNDWVIRYEEGHTGPVMNVPENSTVSIYNISDDLMIYNPNDSEKGGGVYVEGTFINYNVRIQGCGLDGIDVKKGGGVYVADGGKIYAYGGRTSGNGATVAGDGVYVESGGELHVSGAPVLGETYLESGAVITLDGALTEGASITPVLQNKGGDVTAAGEFVTADTLQYFTAPTDNNYVMEVADNKVVITKIAITVYFTDTKDWGNMKASVTKDGQETVLDMTLAGQDADGYNIYCFDTPNTYGAVIYVDFINSEKGVVVDIAEPISHNAGYYPITAGAQIEGNTTYTYGAYTYEGLGVSTSGGNVSMDKAEFKHSLIFGDYVALNFYVTFDASITSPQNATVRFDYEDGTILTVSPTLTDGGDVKTTELGGKLYYTFKAPVDAKEMTDMITATVMLNGRIMSTDLNSVENHALTILNMNTVPEKDKEMVKATLTYGAAAQTYFGYKTEHLATDNIPQSE